MGFRACPRRDDPFERNVRETYGANVVGAPRAGIDPLLTVAKQDDRVEPRGQLKYYFEGDIPALPQVMTVPAVAMSGTRSSELKASLGLDLSANFLAALGLPIPGAQLTTTLWSGASSFSFEVRDVRENQVDLAELGRAIDGKRVADNSSTALFLADASQELLLVTRTLTSSTFAVRAKHAGGQAVQAEADGIAELIGSAKAGVSWRREGDQWVSFEGPTPITFAFSVVPCTIDAGRHLRFGLTRKDLKWGAGEPKRPAAAARPAIGDGDRAGILTFD